MKKYIFLILVCAGFLTSCSLDNDNPPPPIPVFMATESVEVPEFFVVGETYEIFMSYTRPNGCYVFNNILFSIEGAERTVAVVNSYYQNSGCAEEEEELTTVSFDFTVSGNETHVFKFYQGTVDGIDQYHIVEVPVSDD
jgi:hypothetical protein